MRRLEIKDAEVIGMAVQEEIRRSEEARYDHRLHGILLVCSGKGCYEIGRLLGHSPRTIESWVHRFEDRGFAGLREEERPGRPCALDEKAMETLGRHLRKSPRFFGYQQSLWDGKLLSYHIREEFSVDIGIRQCQRLFRKLGFRRRKPRPLIAKADPLAQRAFKKTPENRKRR
jgi:transposase